MAVSAKEVEVRIKHLYPNLNLSRKRMDELSDRLSKIPSDEAKEEEIDKAIANANQFYSFEEIAKKDDKKRSEDKKPDPKPDPEPTSGGDNTQEATPAWAQGLISTVSDLGNVVQVIVTGKVAKDCFGNSTVFKDAPDSIKKMYEDRINPKSDVSIEDQVKGFEEEFNTVIQFKSNTSEFSGTPTNSTGNGEATDDEVNKHF
jgi:hypothetical protein